MTGGTQRLEIALLQSRAALPDGNNVVYNRCLGQPPGLTAFHTERMLDQIVLTEFPPFAAGVELPDPPVTEGGVIPGIHEFLMFCAVAFMRKPRASGIRTWFAGSVRHGCLRANEKPAGFFLLRASQFNNITCQDVDSSGTELDFGRFN